ncbi:MAG: DUF6198 family protein [Clostridia bacterium]
MNIKLLYRILIYILGLFILALGVVFSINSRLGVSPVNSLPYIISVILHADLSVCVVSVFSFYILLQIIILKKDFKWINLFQLAFSLIFGYLVDLSKLIIGNFTIPTYFGQLTMLFISIALITVGISLYINVELIPMAMEGLCLSITRKQKRFTFPTIKIFVDCAAVTLGILLSFIFLHKLDGIREGTIISALLIGFLLKYVNIFVKHALSRMNIYTAKQTT